ncbi:DUF300-domain-containing protein [Punctularia strigosozonata HHB-11173 SS5]|uniref:DUF300-domain-containing protein n=1 Tax=Punctularia strigosozonata (strain HHB-11173) TaxID=741275 RepID=UPI0004418332|nr:DUF300-domain-containing protein [Punctularia strigosozonata HHB-11173 SS5]EIN05458.1 DUF300-domain-containing protein [Punctularia strigosozonata HHB-11173 SS5]
MVIGILPGSGHGPGSGSALNPAILTLAGIATLVATVVSAISIFLHIKNYRKPILQRMVIRIMLMVPLYAISSFISLFSLDAAFFIDAIRDIYEAFVIYCFFQLLLAYLGGERSLLILLHGRPPKEAVFPATLFMREIDVSDPYTFLFLKRGIIQYVQVKPVLAIATLILKATGKYNEGDLRVDSGYLYISIVYNTSICLSLYCLAVFWMVVSQDLKPFRPMPKFLCVKGILFFSFWQSIGISVLVKAGFIKRLGPYTDAEHISLGLTDTLICLEMPLFAIAHNFAFSYHDFVDLSLSYVARMPMYYAFRDAFGAKDVLEDSKATLRGEGMDYRAFEPSEGYIHQGVGRTKRIRAGLRYSQGGKKKYWLPRTTAEREQQHIGGAVKDAVVGRAQDEEVYAPLLEEEAADVVHDAPDMQSPGRREQTDSLWVDTGLRPSSRDDEEDGDGFELPFGDPDPAEDELFEHARRYLFGDYNYPCIDVSSENAKARIWDEEERILRDERGAYFSPMRGPGGTYGAVGVSAKRPRVDSATSSAAAGSPVNKGKGRSAGTPRAGTPKIGSPVGEGYVVDYEWDRADAGDAGSGVKLHWTKARKAVDRQPARTRSPRPVVSRTVSAISASASGSGSGGSAAPSPKDRPVLPPDAVDLVVEDSQAQDEEMTNERRRGEPALRGLRKVYRRGYIVQGEDGREQQVEVEEERDDDDDDDDGDGGGGGGEEGMREGERLQETPIEPVAERVPTPAVVHRGLERLPSDTFDNPWA